MQSSGRGNVSLLQDLLKQAPSGVFGGKDQAGKASELQANATAAQMQNTRISPRQPEAWTRYLQTVSLFIDILLVVQPSVAEDTHSASKNSLSTPSSYPTFGAILLGVLSIMRHMS